MLDLSKYESLGAALRDALEQFAQNVCVIEADREKERKRLTYGMFKAKALPLARALQEADFGAGCRASIIMTNQSKWLISAYAVFFRGGVLVPLDYRLTPAEHWHLLKHSEARVLITEYPYWRQLAASPERAKSAVKTVLVTEAPLGAELDGAQRWEEFRASGEPEFVPRQRKDPACIVYSSGTGGRLKGCVLTHENYLEQCAVVTPIFPFWPGARYLSIIPTNHAIDFNVFIMAFTGGGTVVHLRTLRPEYIRDAFVRYQITYMAVVPKILKNLQQGLEGKFAALSPAKRSALRALIRVNRVMTRGKPRPRLSRVLLKDVHRAFGGELRALLVGGAATEAATIEFFHDLGIPIYNGYGCTEACVAITVNDLKPFRPDTVGKPVRGMEIRILRPDAEGYGEVSVRSKTVMSHYLHDAELTAEAIVDGWLMTGDLGRLEASGHLQLVGRKRNMIVTEEGKNIYPEDIENVFEGLPANEFCVFAANYIWPKRTMTGEQLVLVVHPEPGSPLSGALLAEIQARNLRLLNYKRVHGVVLWEQDFPRTPKLEINRIVLAEQLAQLDRAGAIQPL
jgi:long-chain acyl-CoA synthetase